MAPRAATKKADAKAEDAQQAQLAAVSELLAPPETVERTDEDPPGDNIEFVQSGIIRAWVDGKRYRLRRPFFGEMRTLRTAHQDVRDENEDRAEETRNIGAQVNTEARAIAEDDPERSAKVGALRKRDRAAARKLIDFREDSHLDWWRQVFEALSLDGAPEDMPAWATDELLPIRVLNHWRSVPLGPGTSSNGHKP